MLLRVPLHLAPTMERRAASRTHAMMLETWWVPLVRPWHFYYRRLSLSPRTVGIPRQSARSMDPCGAVLPLSVHSSEPGSFAGFLALTHLSIVAVRGLTLTVTMCATARPSTHSRLREVPWPSCLSAEVLMSPSRSSRSSQVPPVHGSSASKRVSRIAPARRSTIRGGACIRSACISSWARLRCQAG